MRTVILMLALAMPFGAAAAPQCSAEAIEQARKLLDFHMDGDDRAEVAPVAAELPPLSNPIDKRQKFAVFEVEGFVYKGNYRMRLIYHRLGGECILMGQEILQLAKL